MRFRLLRRRLTISAPRVAIRSALPWPFRWLALAVVMGFCAAVALWAFEFGKSIAGIDTVSRDEVVQMRAEISRLREEGQERQKRDDGEAPVARQRRPWRGRPPHRRDHCPGWNRRRRKPIS